MKKYFFPLLSLLFVLSVVLSACAPGTPAAAPDDVATVPPVDTTALCTPSEEEPHGQIGILYTSGGTFKCDGSNWTPKQIYVDTCRATDKEKVRILGDDTADGQPFDALCSIIMDRADDPDVGVQEDGPAIVSTDGARCKGNLNEEISASRPYDLADGVDRTWTIGNEKVTVTCNDGEPDFDVVIIEDTPIAAVSTNTAPAPVTNDNGTVANTEQSMARNAVIAGCQSGQGKVTIGAVTIQCSGNVMDEPTSYTNAPAGFHTSGVTSTGGGCMSNGEMTDAHGLGDVRAVKDGINVEWEGCGKWQIQANGIGTYYQAFLPNWEYTCTDADGTVTVNKGPGGKWAWGCTIRQLETYTSPDQSWVHDDVILMVREFNYGYGMDPRYATVPGVGLDLRGLWHQPKLDQTCPAKNDTVQAAALLGGDDPKFWTAPDWERGAWVFNSKGEGFHHLTWTGEPGYFDVWTEANGAVTVDSAEDAKLFERLNFEEASYHCVPE
jgi:hypothetical protein